MHYAITRPEDRADLQMRQVDVALTNAEAMALVNSGEYQPSFGLQQGRHFRKVRGNGCYHLRVDGHLATFHWDEWDPRRFPIEHFFETPALWGTTAAFATLALAIRYSK